MIQGSMFAKDREGWTTEADVRGRDVPLVVAYGGGVDSTAMLIEMLRRDIRPDAVLFADTHGEMPATYEFVAEFSAWLARRDVTLVVVDNAVSSKYTSLEDNCLQMKTLPSRAFGWSSCAQKWKHAPQDKWVNNWPPGRAAFDAKKRVIKAIGYDGGEERRASIHEDAKYRYWYPLIEWGIERVECLDLIQAAGLTKPPPSSCFFCPSSTKKEVLALAENHPDLFARAVAMERNAQENLGVIKGLGRHWSWENLVSLNVEQRAALREQPVEQCMACADGSERG